MSEREPITAAIRKSLDASWDPWPAAREGLRHKCDAIDSIHANLERENDRLKCELDRVLGELDEMQKTDGISDKCGSAMHEVSITDELRAYAGNFYLFRYKDVREKLDAIADRIDAEHQKALDEWEAKHGQMWLKGYAECHAELLEGNETLASDLESCGWIRLPVDADGIPVHIDDVMEWPDGRTFEVVGIGDGTLFYVESDDADHAEWTGASTKRHHHVPTVEDVLTKMLEQAVGYSDAHTTVALDTIAEYAAKLRLAGDAE